MIIKPSLVIATGIAGTGKTTVLKEVIKRTPNTILLEKDVLDQAMLHVNHLAGLNSLQSLNDYIEKDISLGEKTRVVKTSVGEMTQLRWGSDYFGRHVRDTTYLVMESIATKNLELGKVPIIDCMVIRQIRDGTLRRFMESTSFSGYSVHVIHFTAEEEDVHRRLEARKDIDPVAYARTAEWISSKEKFHQFVTEIQPFIPSALSQYEHLIINTSKQDLEQCVKVCLDYII